jgi:hypothetical protein
MTIPCYLCGEAWDPLVGHESCDREMMAVSVETINKNFFKMHSNFIYLIFEEFETFSKSRRRPKSNYYLIQGSLK